MSRRKQPKPRHIESEDEVASILEQVPESRPAADTPNPTDDAHVCGKCRQEFIGLTEFLAHKKVCSRKRVVVLYDAETDDSDSQADESLGSSFNAKVPKLADASDYIAGGSDGEVDDLENLDDDDNEIMDAEDREIANEEIDEDLIKIQMMNAQEEMSDEEEEEEDYDEGDRNNNDKEKKDDDKLTNVEKQNIPPHLNPFMFPFLPNSNVVLEPISATRAAVAQFAENNMSPTENNVLHSTLYNLQQQQILQLQLIHQLQQQIVTGMQHPMSGNGLPMLPSSLPPSLTSSVLSQSMKFDIDDLPMKLTKDSVESEKEKTRDESSNEQKSEEEESKNKDDSATLSMPTSVPSAFPLPSSNLTSTTPPTSEFAKLTKLVERSQYVSEDPFFRHKCRLCHKVFGSDSALQIHIRSHTGERPFKCNICGNRFTTRGNLKVHFERHKAKYPHVKMNPHPVPEHLDKIPSMPMLGHAFTSTAQTPLHLQSRMINATPPMSIASMMSSIYSGPDFGPRPQRPHFPFHRDEQRSLSPVSTSSSSQTSPTPTASDAASRKSPTVDEKSNLAISPNASTAQVSPPRSESVAPTKFPIPVSSSLPVHMSSPSPFPMLSHLPTSAPPPLLSSSVAMGPSSRDSILPTKMISHDDNLEKYMEIDRSETSKLQQLVDNLEKKVSDPNQCVICHRVLSCKSALQMHYRIHTGERPYKCKICGRAFTTKGNLKTHMGVHRMKPPIRMMHQCPVCHKSFTNLLVLQQHIRSHASLPGISSLPDFSSMKDMHFRPFPSMNWPPRPLDFSFHEDNERELDLSKSSAKYEKDDVDDTDSYYDREEHMDIDDDDLKDENTKEEDLKEDEQPSGDSGTGSDEGRQSVDDTDKPNHLDTATRPGSATSGLSNDSGRSASPVSDDERVPTSSAMEMYASMAPMTSSSYTSLAALEERVRAIDSSMTQHRFNPFFMNGTLPPMTPTEQTNGASGQYGSESDGNISGDDGSKPGTPALSVNSDGGSSAHSGLVIGGDKHATTCNICYKTFACRSALDIHYRSHTKERPFSCGACDKSFSTRGNMKQHMLTHKIRDLPNSFNTNSNGSNAQENSNSNDSHQDEIENKDIEKSPKSTENLQTSAESSHSNRECVSNGHSTTSSNSDTSPFLRRTPLKHQCQVCQKGFSSASALQIHIRTHTGDKPFKCTVCGKAFTTKGNLKVHMGTHMWNNSPSRRGRRMSIEPPFMLAHKDNPYMPGFHHRSPPDFFPFQFPPFMNGVPPHKMNEISVIQSLGGGMGGPIPQLGMAGADHLLSPRTKSDKEDRKSDYLKMNESNGSVTPSGELDLSMKSNSQTSPNNNNSKTSPTSIWNSSWKTICHRCNQNFPSPTLLELHMQNVHLKGGMNLEAKV